MVNANRGTIVPQTSRRADQLQAPSTTERSGVPGSGSGSAPRGPSAILARAYAREPAFPGSLESGRKKTQRAMGPRDRENKSKTAHRRKPPAPSPRPGPAFTERDDAQGDIDDHQKQLHRQPRVNKGILPHNAHEH